MTCILKSLKKMYNNRKMLKYQKQEEKMKRREELAKRVLNKLYVNLVVNLHSIDEFSPIDPNLQCFNFVCHFKNMEDFKFWVNINISAKQTIDSKYYKTTVIYQFINDVIRLSSYDVCIRDEIEKIKNNKYNSFPKTSILYLFFYFTKATFKYYDFKNEKYYDFYKALYTIEIEKLYKFLLFFSSIYRN